MKKRILMVHNFYQIGGGEHTVFENEVNLLRNHGHEVVEYTRSNEELKQSKLKLLISPFSTIWSMKTFREVRSIIKKQEIDIVHCHNTFPLISPSVYAAAHSMKVPVVQTIHNFRFVCPCGLLYTNGTVCEKCLEYGFLEAIKRKCYRSSFVQTAIVAAMLTIHRMLGTYKRINYIFLTEFNRDKIGKKLGLKVDRMYVKPNFSSKIRNADSIERYYKGKFFFVGRLDEYKGVRNLVEMWRKKDYGTLYIYGDGELAEYVKSVEDGKKIVFKGFCKKEDIYQECADAEAMIFSSKLYEGFPMTIVESFSCGIPVISTNIGNAGAIVQDGLNGFKYEIASEESFNQAIENVRRAGSELRKKSYGDYLRHYTCDANYEMLMEIYREIGEKNE